MVTSEVEDSGGDELVDFFVYKLNDFMPSGPLCIHLEDYDTNVLDSEANDSLHRE